MRKSCWLAPFGFLLLPACGGEEAAPAPVATSAPTPPPTPTPTPTPTQSVTTLSQFGFAAIACDHDDPFDAADKTDYSDEVAGFSNLNQVCLTGDIAADRDRIAASAAQYDPLLYIEPVFFDPATNQPRSTAQADALWTGVQQSITDSGIDPARITFYLFDEPTLRGVALDALEPMAGRIRAAYPASPLLLIEAFSTDSDPVVPAYADLWGFNAYTVRDPAAQPLYTDFLDTAAAQLRDGQALVLVGDGIHTPFHTAEGLSEADMAQVAANYFAYAQARDDVAAMLVYTWAGGIDNNQERGVRDLPMAVQSEWERIGRAITQR